MGSRQNETVDPIPPEELAKLDALEAAATPGPWGSEFSKPNQGHEVAPYKGDELDWGREVCVTCDGPAGADAKLIVALRNAYKPLRAALRDPEGVAATIWDRAEINAEKYRIAQEERDAALARAARLERALERIANDPDAYDMAQQIARAALAQEEENDA